jgi:hypothetical protein
MSEFKSQVGTPGRYNEEIFLEPERQKENTDLCAGFLSPWRFGGHIGHVVPTGERQHNPAAALPPPPRVS